MRAAKSCADMWCLVSLDKSLWVVGGRWREGARPHRRPAALRRKPQRPKVHVRAAVKQQQQQQQQHTSVPQQRSNNALSVRCGHRVRPRISVPKVRVTHGLQQVHEGVLLDRLEGVRCG